MRLAGVFVPKRLLQLELLILLTQPLVLFVHGVEVNVSAPEAADATSGTDDGALERAEHRDRPHADEPDGAAIRMASVYRAFDLRREPHDLSEQCPGEDNRVAVPGEESFCRAAVFGG